jgi:excisionase family DNA binding protein
MSLRTIEPVTPSAADISMAEELDDALKTAEGRSRIRVTIAQEGGERTVELTERDYPALAQAFSQIANGGPVVVLPLDEELSTQQAADLLNVSRPYLIKLLERAEIPFRTVGAWRRVRLADVLAYRQKSDSRSSAALHELADQAQDLDLGH